MAHTALLWMPGTAAVELTPPCAACHALRSICGSGTTAPVKGLHLICVACTSELPYLVTSTVNGCCASSLTEIHGA